MTVNYSADNLSVIRRRLLISPPTTVSLWGPTGRSWAPPLEHLQERCDDDEIIISSREPTSAFMRISVGPPQVIRTSADTRISLSVLELHLLLQLVRWIRVWGTSAGDLRWWWFYLQVYGAKINLITWKLNLKYQTWSETNMKCDRGLFRRYTQLHICHVTNNRKFISRHLVRALTCIQWQSRISPHGLEKNLI